MVKYQKKGTSKISTSPKSWMDCFFVDLICLLDAWEKKHAPFMVSTCIWSLCMADAQVNIPYMDGKGISNFRNGC